MIEFIASCPLLKIRKQNILSTRDWLFASVSLDVSTVDTGDLRCRGLGA